MTNEDLKIQEAHRLTKLSVGDSSHCVTYSELFHHNMMKLADWKPPVDPWHERAEALVRETWFKSKIVAVNLVHDALLDTLDAQAAAEAAARAMVDSLEGERCIETATGQGQLDQLLNAIAQIQRTRVMGIPDFKKLETIGVIARQALHGSTRKPCIRSR
jgi:hypothetical protein